MNAKVKTPTMVLELNTSDVIPDPEQVRKHFDKEALAELAASMNTEQIQPIIVRPADAEGKYKIISGERRWRAAEMVSRPIKAIVREAVSEEQVRAMQLVENIQRSQLSPIEVSRALIDMKDAFGFKQQQLGEMLGRSQSYISSHLSLNPSKLPECVVELADAEITTDYDALNLLRRLHEENATLCEQLCSTAIDEGVVSRKKIQAAMDNNKKIASDILYDQNTEKEARFNSKEQAADTAHKQDLKTAGLDEEGFDYDESDVETLGDAPDGFDEPKKAKTTPVPAGMTGDDEDSLPGDKEDDDPLAKGWEKREPQHASIIVNVATETDIIKGKLVLDRLDACKQHMWVQIWNAKTDKYKYQRVHVEDVQIVEVIG